MGLILSALLKTELPDALVKVIVTSKSELSILATVLLGEILHLAHVLLPRELNATSHCLPALLSHVASNDPVQANRASEAVDALQVSVCAHCAVPPCASKLIGSWENLV